MPRSYEIEVEPYPDYTPDRYYVLRVTSISRSKKPRGLTVELEHLDQDQDGRKVEVFLGPLRPDGRTASFFRACGQEICIGTKARPEECQGKVISARFARDLGETWQVSNFKPIKEQTS
jgi:hypothetical protein